MSTAYISHPDCLRHEMGRHHPECPQRLQAIEDQLILSRIDCYLTRIDPPLATEEQLALVHTQDHIDFIKSHAPESGYYSIDGDTTMNAHTWQAALRSAGGAIAAVDAVMSGEVKNAFTCLRPPGHHAEPHLAMGFCFFNNIAIAAKHALEKHGVDRVAIIDFDVHHGNGTEAAFKNDPRVLMCSYFQHPFYPYSGADVDLPNMVNVPLPAYTDGVAVREVVELAWLPRLREFKPQLILISAGFDAHREDDMGQMALVEADYAWITRQLMTVANETAQGRIVSCLEGGYSLSALARSVVAHLKELADL
ncbi:histone deacetylase family protein [Polynucleobacter sp. MWH-Spelu-300-X4]|uniref:histone deacetylase family protein n=1 Tax=Polynucleobacter sp. MWH-Spelu-300-X4 TaxID=2689109 RepID=UPI001BFD337D|nr:histone deacetylase family protein [Polynucleobacter sp. MWH-Spelu-300-X4]QWD80240.1 histone deacetylase family protein [Polynucleobacter sp. MWH-Spelu-300-X4]